MNTGATNLITQLIAAAITPVALISACAALILGINNKHSGISDRIRQAAADIRKEQSETPRCMQLRRQVHIFFIRFRLTWYALVALYAAIVCLSLCVLLIVYSQQHQMVFSNGTLLLFIASVVLMLVASFLEIGEVGLSMRSLRAEVTDIWNSPEA
jgi:CHASE3 domain sensor protein